MKKFLIIIGLALTSLGSFASDPIKIDQKIIASFQSHFPNARDVTWHDFSQSYEVYFIDAGVQLRILYRKDQSLVRVIRYYQENNLPYDIFYILKKELPGRKIYGVTEISTVTQPGSQLTREYELTMFDDTKWYILKMDSNGTYTVVKKFARA
jgi:hypothetical protein